MYIGWDGREYEDVEMDNMLRDRAEHKREECEKLARLRRLNREYTHMRCWHSRVSQRMIETACEKLHYRVYGEVCYYGALSPEAYAWNSPWM